MKRHYKRLREKGWHARQALRAAKSKDAFETLEHTGLVRLRVEPDHLSARDLFPDDSEEEIERANRLGIYGIIVEARHPLSGEDGPWEHVDSCWGFVGDDWEDSGYDTDFYENALDWLAQFEGMSS